MGRNDSNKDSMLWDRKQLLESTYEEGRAISKALCLIITGTLNVFR